MSCKCQNCGKFYKIDLIIPDKLWETIKPKGKKGAGLLCGKCIIKFLESTGEYRALQLGEAASSTSPNKQSESLLCPKCRLSKICKVHRYGKHVMAVECTYFEA